MARAVRAPGHRALSLTHTPHGVRTACGSAGTSPGGQTVSSTGWPSTRNRAGSPDECPPPEASAASSVPPARRRRGRGRSGCGSRTGQGRDLGGLGEIDKLTGPSSEASTSTSDVGGRALDASGNLRDPGGICELKNSACGKFLSATLVWEGRRGSQLSRSVRLRGHDASYRTRPPPCRAAPSTPAPHRSRSRALPALGPRALPARSGPARPADPGLPEVPAVGGLRGRRSGPAAGGGVVRAGVMRRRRSSRGAPAPMR